MARSAAVVVALLVALPLAGCLGSSPSDDGGQTPDETPGEEAGDDLSATLSADQARGRLPLNVTFTVDASEANATWRLDFGDGNATSGDEVGATVEHTYFQTGQYVATADVTFDDGSMRTAQQTIVVQPPPPPDPVQARWNASAIAGLPHPERVSPQPLPDAAPTHAEVAKQAYDNGANETVVLGYEVDLSKRHRSAAAAAVATPIHPQVPVPDYDLYLFAPNGSLVGSSQNNGTIEQVRTDNVTEGTWLLLLAFWAGADVPDEAPANVITVFVAA